ncbi:MAG TPA: nitrate reductase molybdenum cofactor assembly chaperone [Gaiellaceae bacterium]|nr:nitrate reductase molybdenum cofactor assembly chaperone [Gaiellaceae bacterium]
MKQPRPYKLLSVLLSYPDRRLADAHDEIAAAVDALARSPQRAALRRFVSYLAANTQTELERRYVETFDLRRRSGLYLSYYVHGDTRKRGMALLRLKRLYAAAGLELTSGELPDYLPLMLEFSALSSDGAGELLLREHRPALELLRHSLRDADSPYADLIDAICAGLPRLSALEREHVRRLSEDGPPSEQVGLQPFAPREVVPTEARV